MRQYVITHGFHFTSLGDKFEDKMKNGISEKKAKLKLVRNLTINVKS